MSRWLSSILVLAGVLAGIHSIGDRLLPRHALRPPVSATASGQPSKNAGKVKSLPTGPSTDTWPQISAADPDGELLRLARMLVARSPEDALAWAQSPAEAALRQRLLSAVLQAWGELDPRAAVNWALTQNAPAREANMKAALAGAATRPELAMQIASDLLAQDRDSGGVYATLLAAAFSANGNFQAALQFINQSPAEAMGDPVSATFRAWAQGHPTEAMTAINSLTDAQLRQTALQVAVAAWNASDPAGLAAYANAMSPGTDRDYALGEAIDNWSLQDPSALSAWLATLPPGDEFDYGTAMMLVRTDGANRTPTEAMQWVESIHDPVLKQDSLMTILGEWRQSDLSAARQYVAGADWLDDAQRQAAMGYLSTGD